jgi:hypothetical protein
VFALICSAKTSARAFGTALPFTTAIFCAQPGADNANKAAAAIVVRICFFIGYLSFKTYQK